jgi:IclR family transcriptional regulator, KDG regulon repressor
MAESRALLASVRNAARVLRAFSHADQALGVTELARRLELTKSTTHRLVATLEVERLLERDRATGKYRLGLALYELGTTVTEHLDLHQAVLPVMTTVRHSTGEMVQVAVLDGLEVVYVERLESHHLLPVFRRVGHRLPAHATSSGKVLLAALPRSEQERRLHGAALNPRTSRTITDAKALLVELADVAVRGWASNLQEGEFGVSSVGAPIRDAAGKVIASVTVVGSSERITHVSLHHYRTAVIEAASVISRRLGYRGRPGSGGHR